MDRTEVVALAREEIAKSTLASLVRQLQAGGQWQAITFNAVNTGATAFAGFFCEYRKDPGGLVEFRGLLKATAALAANATLLNLPVGLRTSAGASGAGLERFFPVWCSLGGVEKIGACTLETPVSVTPNAVLTRQAMALGDWIALDGLQWRAEG